MRIAYVVGTRPNFVKVAPVLAALERRLPDARHVLIHVGQHYDPLMSDVLFRDLGLRDPDHMLHVGSGTHTQQTARAMARIEPVLARERPSLVLVAGDVNSTLAAAIAAVQLPALLAHIESGLRSFDRAMPEEHNRVLTDHLADLLFAHCADAVNNLRAEGIGEERIDLVGNTMIDSLVAVEPRFRAAQAAEARGLRSKDYLLVTLHRPALVDGPLLLDVAVQLRQLSRALPVVFPVHPRTRRALTDLDLGPHVQLTDPVGYIEFLSLEADAAAVLTDSGGVQEETTFLGVPCFTLRANTERPITIREGTNTLVGLDPTRIKAILDALEVPRQTPLSPPPLWDGYASERVANRVQNQLVQASSTRASSRTPVGRTSAPVKPDSRSAAVTSSGD